MSSYSDDEYDNENIDFDDNEDTPYNYKNDDNYDDNENNENNNNTIYNVIDDENEYEDGDEMYIDDDEEDGDDENELHDNIVGGSKDGEDDEESYENKNNHIYNFNEDDESTDENYENYLQKFDNDLKKDYILSFHQECNIHNFNEVKLLSNVVRNENNIIIDDLHKTLPYLTKYEKTRILGMRALQINSGAKPFIKVPENIIDGYLIAQMELKEKKLPYIIRRPIGNSFEYWKVEDLEDILW